MPPHAQPTPAAQPIPVADLAQTRRFKLALFSYNEYGIREAHALVNSTGLVNTFDLTWGDLAKHADVDCDIAISAFTMYDDPERFITDTAALHLIRKVPAVFAAICKGGMEKIGPRRNDISAAEVFELPIAPDRLVKAIMTHTVSIRLKYEKAAATPDKRTRPKQLGEILVEHGLITPLQLAKALDYQKSTNMRLGDTLVSLGYIDEEQKTRFLASQLGVEVATAKMFASAEIEVVALIPEHVAKRNTCIALDKDGAVLTVAMTDVLNLQLLDNLRDLTDLTINPVLAPRADIESSIERYYRDVSSQKDASDLVADLDEEMEYVQDEDGDDLSIEEAAAAGAEMGIVKLVNMIVANAIRDKASDIHIEPMDKELVVRCRVDGDLRRVMSPPKQSHQAIITRIKILSDMDIAERRIPQDGRMVVKMGRREVDIRVSILPTIFGEKAVMRILDKEAFEKSVANLGFTEKSQAIFKEQINKPYGMIVVTGPTGSGKSTTLYSAMQSVKSVTKNIITVEDPVEFHMEGINQVGVNAKAGLTFAAALRSILRQDPDVILIGEIRDGETADIAIKMALTGHLVFSTLHTNDACSSVARFVDIGIPPLLLASALNLVIAQRLVRRICKKCKVEYTPEPEMIEQLNLQGKKGLKFYKGEGCVNCNGSGYSGRVAIFEMLAISREIRKMILKNEPTFRIFEQAQSEGMLSLREAGIEKVLSGDTTIEQVIAATTDI